MGARLTAVERVSDQHSVRLDAKDKNEEYVWKSIAELRNALQAQGIRLALIFGGINLLVVGIGFLVGFTTLLEKISNLAGK